MKEKRNLTGCYFRSFNNETQSWENRCFEDLNEEEQNKILSEKSPEFIKGLVKILSNTLNDIGNQFDLQA